MRFMRGRYRLGDFDRAGRLIAKRQVEIAAETGADAVAHGATGKGNDQCALSWGIMRWAPDIKVVAPWREWGFEFKGAVDGVCAGEGDSD